MMKTDAERPAGVALALACGAETHLGLRSDAGY